MTSVSKSYDLKRSFSSDVLKRGVLAKKSRKWYTTSGPVWKDRLVKLFSDRLAYSSPNDGKAAETIALADIGEIVVCSDDYSGPPNEDAEQKELHIRTTTGSVYTFRAKTADEALGWRQAIVLARQLHSPYSPGFLKTSSSATLELNDTALLRVNDSDDESGADASDKDVSSPVANIGSLDSLSLTKSPTSSTMESTMLILHVRVHGMKSAVLNVAGPREELMDLTISEIKSRIFQQIHQKAASPNILSPSPFQSPRSPLLPPRPSDGEYSMLPPRPPGKAARTSSQMSPQDNYLKSPLSSEAQSPTLRLSTSSASSSNLAEVIKNGAERYVLKLESAFEDIWATREAKHLSYYYNKSKQPSEVESQVLPVLLVPANLCPPEKLHCFIIGTKQQTSDLTEKQYTVYRIVVRYENLEWEVLRRYSDFLSLHEKLMADIHKDGSDGSILPRMPSKHILIPKQSSGSFIDSRRKELQEFLEDLVAIPTIAQNYVLLAFLGVLSTSRHATDTDVALPVIHVSRLSRAAKFGDVVLFQCKFTASELQRTFTRREWDHVGLVVPSRERRGAVDILEATGEGVQTYPLMWRLKAYAHEVTTKIVIRHLEVYRTSEMASSLAAFAEEVVGKPYSLQGLFTKGLLRREGSESKEDPQKYFCSQLVATGLKRMGVLPNDFSSAYFWPASFGTGGDIDAALKEGSSFGQEILIDCKVVEVSRAQSVKE